MCVYNVVMLVRATSWTTVEDTEQSVLLRIVKNISSC